jgi:hypothetical protein
VSLKTELNGHQHNTKMMPRRGEVRVADAEKETCAETKVGTSCTNNGKTTPRSRGVREADAKEEKCKG